jgi:hypothetical protein
MSLHLSKLLFSRIVSVRLVLSVDLGLLSELSSEDLSGGTGAYIGRVSWRHISQRCSREAYLLGIASMKTTPPLRRLWFAT